MKDNKIVSVAVGAVVGGALAYWFLKNQKAKKEAQEVKEK